MGPVKWVKRAAAQSSLRPCSSSSPRPTPAAELAIDLGRLQTPRWRPAIDQGYQSPGPRNGAARCLRHMGAVDLSGARWLRSTGGRPPKHCCLKARPGAPGGCAPRALRAAVARGEHDGAPRTLRSDALRSDADASGGRQARGAHIIENQAPIARVRNTTRARRAIFSSQFAPRAPPPCGTPFTPAATGPDKAHPLPSPSHLAPPMDGCA
jgi:hypothetical protein